MPSRRLARWRKTPMETETRIVSHGMVKLRRSPCLPDGAGNGSACRWQADERIIAHFGDGFQCHVAGPLDGPLIILFEQ